MKNILNTIALEFKIEWRQKHSISAVLLYVFATLFVCFLSFNSIDNPKLWNALFWIILMFSITQAVTRNFSQSNQHNLLMFSFVSAEEYILGKFIYNGLFAIFMSVISWGLYTFLIDSSGINDMNSLMYLSAVILGGLGFSSILTFVNGIASKTDGGVGLVAILGFPLLLPLIIIGIKFSNLALQGFDWSISYKYILQLSGINVLIVSLGYLLFPYIWQE